MASTKQEGELGEVYAAETSEELAEVYDRWSDDYDRYMNEGGYRHPAICSALAARYISDLQSPLIDAGVGTGLVGELLSLLGYQQLIGIDISERMLNIASHKGIYSELKTADLLSCVNLPKDHYTGAVAAGVFTTGHVGPKGFETLCGLVRQNGRLIITIKSTIWDSGFSKYLEKKERSGTIKVLEKTDLYNSIPGAPTNVPSLAVAIEKLRSLDQGSHVEK